MELVDAWTILIETVGEATSPDIKFKHYGRINEALVTVGIAAGMIAPPTAPSDDVPVVEPDG